MTVNSKTVHKDIIGDRIVLIKIFLTYIQIIAIFGSIPVRWPGIVENTTTLGDEIVISSSDSLSLDCLFGKLRGDTSIFYFKTIIINLIPFIFMVLAVLFWLIWFWIKDYDYKKYHYLNKVIATIIIIGFNEQPSVID